MTLRIVPVSFADAISTVEELDALPVESVAVDAGGDVWRHAEAGWCIAGYFGIQSTRTARMPVTVLYRPDRPVSPELSADDLDRYERIADPIYRSTHVAEQASKYLVSDLGQYVVRLVAEVRALRSTVSPQVDRDALARELTNHHVTRGMQVASGVTCECGDVKHQMALDRKPHDSSDSSE